MERLLFNLPPGEYFMKSTVQMLNDQRVNTHALIHVHVLDIHVHIHTMLIFCLTLLSFCIFQSAEQYIYKYKNEVGCRDDTMPKTVDTRRHCEED